MVTPEEYGDKYAAQYRDGDFETTMVRVRRARVLASLGRYPHQHILEVGCGLEPLFTFCDGYSTYTVVEPVEEFAARARSLARGRANIRILQRHFEDRNLEATGTEPFDFVIVSSLLHEVPDPVLFLRRLHAVCDSATVVHLNVPNVYSFHRLLALEMGLIENLHIRSTTEAKFGRHTRFDRATLQVLLQENGFEVLAEGTYFVKPFTHEQMAALLTSGIVSPAVLDGLERMVKYLPDMGCELFAEIRKR